MDEEKKETYEDLSEAVDQYGGESGDDMLTDSDALARSEEAEKTEEAVGYGERIRKSRELHGFTIEELAQKSGIDATALSQVEAGEAVLPLGQLIKLTKALSLRMADVFSEAAEPYTIVRAETRAKFSRFGEKKLSSHGYEYEALAEKKKDRKVDPFVVTLHPASNDEPSNHDGQEFIYVLEGEMEVLIEDTKDVLRPGDAVYYDSTSRHLVRAHGDKPAKILAIIIS